MVNILFLACIICFFHDRKIGLFPEAVNISDSSASNIYTILRPIIEDFSLPGGIVIFYFVGFFSSFIYYIENNPVLKLWSMSLFVSILGWSLVTNILTYNVIMFAFLVNLLVLFNIKRRFNVKV